MVTIRTIVEKIHKDDIMQDMIQRILDQDKEMETHVELEGSNTYPDPLEGEDEVKKKSFMKNSNS